jgi:hypothetical protein
MNTNNNMSRNNTIAMNTNNNMNRNNVIVMNRNNNMNRNNGIVMNQNNNMNQSHNENLLLEDMVEEKEVRQNEIINNMLQDHTKYHFFIGSIFKNTKQIQDLVNIKKNIKKKLKYSYGINDYHSNYQLSTNLIYLGYFSYSVAKEYMNNIVGKLLSAISESRDIQPLMCEYSSYKIKDDKKYYKISIEYDDISNILSKIIIPYLYENGIQPIYNKKNYEKPAIDLLYFKKEDVKNKDKITFSMNIPKNKFILDHLSLLRGLPTKIRSGTPSTHNQMNMEEMSEFTYKLSNDI